MSVYSRIICWCAWQGGSLFAPFVLRHCFVGTSLLALHCCSGLFFVVRLWIMRATTWSVTALNLGESWVFIMMGL